ncbi:Endonuclease/exonuclease/phosphatase, partial [Coprinopsis sp. MPI-PUGE-AT-0042]
MQRTLTDSVPNTITNYFDRTDARPIGIVAGSRRQPRKKKNLKANIKIATLNMRGGGSDNTADKWQHIRQIMRENKLGILALQETHLKPNTVNDLNSQFEVTTRVFNSTFGLNANTAGVAFVLNKSHTRWADPKTYEIIPGRALLLVTPWKGNQNICILNVYTPNASIDNWNFWTHLTRELKDPRYKSIQPQIVLGDFNKVEDPIDRLPIDSDDLGCIEALRQLKNKLGIRDGWRDENPDGIEFTYMQDIATGPPSQSRIDRIYATDEVLQNSRNFISYHSGLPTADHKLVQFQLFDPSSPDIGEGRWAMPIHAIENEELKECFAVALGKAIGQVEGDEGTNPQTALAKLKTEMRCQAKEWCKTRIPKLKQPIKAKESAVKKINRDKSLTEYERKDQTGQLENEIKVIASKLHKTNRLDTQTRYVVENEVIGKVWINAH